MNEFTNAPQKPNVTGFPHLANGEFRKKLEAEAKSQSARQLAAVGGQGGFGSTPPNAISLDLPQPPVTAPPKPQDMVNVEAAETPIAAQDSKAGGDVTTEQAQSAHTAPSGGPLAPSEGTDTAEPQSVQALVAAKVTTEAAKTEAERLPALPAPISAATMHPSDMDFPIKEIFETIVQIGQLTVIGAGGGTGKSFMRQALALDGANGRPSLGYRFVSDDPFAPSMHIISEDTIELDGTRLSTQQLDRTVDELPVGYDHNNRAHYEEVMGRIRYYDANANKLSLFVRSTGGEAVEHEVGIQRFIAYLKNCVSEFRLAMLFFDPFVNVGEQLIEENDNLKMNMLMRVLDRIAKEVNIAVVLISHVAKGATGNDSDSLNRGASAVRDGARLGTTLSRISQSDAKGLFIPEQVARYVRQAKCVKLTFGDDSRGDKLFRLKTFEVTFRCGKVQTMARLVEYHPPKPTSDIDRHIPELNARLIAGSEPAANDDEPPRLWSPDHQAKQNYVAQMISEVCGKDNTKAGRAVMDLLLRPVVQPHNGETEVVPSLWIKGTGKATSSNKSRPPQAILPRSYFDVIGKSHEDDAFS